MNRIRLSAAVALCALVPVQAGDDLPPNKLPEAAAKVLSKADELEVYSLDGGTKADKDTWHGAKVLGKTTVKGDAAGKLATALAKGVSDGRDGARCFIPRHGVRAVHDGKTYDFVICFQCGWFYVYEGDSDKPTVLVTSDGAKSALEKILTAARVPLAKPEK